MDFRRRREIGEIADGVREALELKVQVDVDRAIQLLGGTLTQVAPTEAEAYVEKHGESFVIGISDAVAPTRRRFSIAHEFGHLFLHMGYLMDVNKWTNVARYEESIKYRFGYSEEEYEAHEFAGAFLMPETEFREVAESFRRENKYQVISIADHFGVSVDAASTRGRWLRIFAWD